MQFKYTIDPNADEPIMLIDKHIGEDENGIMGVDGNEFASELLFLDSIGKKCIEIRINSVGGSVMHGMSIYNAILKSSAKVNTHNVGICASIAAVIFQAGRKRIMADYSLLMIHNPSGGDKGLLAKMKESLIVMLSRKSGKKETEISKMMDKETWLTATEAQSIGFCSDIEVSAELNKPRLVAQDVNNAWMEADKILNSYKPKKTNNMQNVINKLGLANDATEDVILGAIASIENKAKNDIAELTNKLTAIATENTALKAEKEKAEADAKAKAELEATNKANELVDGAVTSGKIANVEEVVNNWKKLAVANYDMTVSMIGGLTVNKQGVNLSKDIKDTAEVNLTNAIANDMAELRNKLSI